MTDSRELAVRLVALALLKDRIASEEARIRDELSRKLEASDRVAARLTDGTRVGLVYVAEGQKKVQTVNHRALAEFVADNWPHNVETRVVESFLPELRKMCRNGEHIPGMRVNEGNPTLTVKPDTDLDVSAIRGLSEMIQANAILAIEAADAARHVESEAS